MTKKEKLLKEKLNEILNDHSIFEVTSPPRGRGFQ